MASPSARSCLRFERFEEAVGDPVLVSDENIAAVAEKLLSLVDDRDGERLFLDLRNVRFVRLVTWEVLLRLRRRLLTRGKGFCLCNVGPEVSEVLEITKLNRVFDVQRATSSRAQTSA